MKELLKKYIRPPLIPLVRFPTRYAPHHRIRKFLWNTIVAPYFQHARFRFLATTEFGATIAGNTEDLLQRYVYYFGLWEPNLTDFLRLTLRPGDVFVDVGSNIGYFSLQGSRLVGKSGKVVAIEASPRIFEMLNANLSRNGAENVEPFNLAVADEHKTLRIFLAAESNICETGIFVTDGSRFECEVPAKPLDAILAPKDIARARLIKIDVEGAEWFVVNGMQRVLSEGREDLELVVEVKPRALQTQGKTVQDLFAIFSAAGFHPYELENDYSPRDYVSRRKSSTRPIRIRDPIVKQADVVFSRRDVEQL